jgi:hypothetical protein
MKTKLSSCPSQAHFLRAVSGESGQEEKAEFVGHVSECARCQAKLKLLNSLRREIEAVDHKLEGIDLTPKEARAFRKMARSRFRQIKDDIGKKSASRIAPYGVRRFAFAAGLLMILIIGYGSVRYLIRRDINRGGSGVSFRLIAPLGRIDRAPSEFSWSPVKNTDIYIFKLIDENLKIIYYTNDTIRTSFILDPGVRSRLERGTVYLWTIEAISDASDKLAFGEGTFVIR